LLVPGFSFSQPPLETEHHFQVLPYFSSYSDAGDVNLLVSPLRGIAKKEECEKIGDFSLYSMESKKRDSPSGSLPFYAEETIRDPGLSSPF